MPDRRLAITGLASCAAIPAHAQEGGDSAPSFAQAVGYVVSAGAASIATARREVVRYAAWPGQAVGHKLGMMEIEDARRRAEARPGFDLRRFHRRLLATGEIPVHRLTAHLDAGTA